MLNGFVKRLSKEEEEAFEVLLGEGWDTPKVGEGMRDSLALVIEECLKNGG